MHKKWYLLLFCFLFNESLTEPKIFTMLTSALHTKFLARSYAVVFSDEIWKK